MTREEYLKKYGVPATIPKEVNIDISSAPIRMTRAEYDAKYRPQEQASGGIFGPAKEAIGGLGEVYGLSGNPQNSYINKVKQDVVAGAQDMQKGFSQDKATIGGGLDVAKGAVKIGARVAGDTAGVIFAPFGAAIQATGANKLFDYIGKLSQKGGKYNPINAVTDIPTVQKFVMTHPNIGEDFSRAMNLALSKGETGKIDVKTAIPRTLEQIKTGIESTKQGVQKISDFRTNKATQKVADEIFNIENSYNALQKANSFSNDTGKASRERIAQTDVLSNIVSDNGKIDISSAKVAAREYLKQTVDGSEGVVRDLLIKEGKQVNLSEVAKVLTDKVYSSGLEGSALVKAVKGIKIELEGLKLRADELGNIDLSKIHDAKISETQNINYKTDSTPSIRYKKSKASAYKEIVENKSAVKVNDKYDVKAINKELSKYLEDAKRIEMLGGKNVKGSKLGKYSAQLSGQLIGGSAGALFGPAGAAIGGALGGEAAGFIKGKQMESTFGKPRGLDVKPNEILTQAKLDAQGKPVVNLKIADIKVGAPNTISKTKEIFKLENNIKRNVEQQKVAIKAGDFTLVATLKEIYQVLVQSLKDVIKRIKDTPNKEGGFIKIGKDVKSDPLAQEAKKYKSAEEYVDSLTKQKYSPTTEYFQSKGLPKDLADYASMKASEMQDMRSPTFMDIAQGKFKNFITGKRGSGKTIIYRAVPKGEKINISDMVFTDRKMAESFQNEYGFKRGQQEIVSQKVDGADLMLLREDSFPGEAVYFPKSLEGIKTKSQLTDIWNKANQKDKAI